MRVVSAGNANTEFAEDTYRIRDWTFRTRTCELERGKEQVKLEPKVANLLRHLIANTGSPVSRDELMETVWPGVVVGEQALHNAINKLRKALGDERKNPKFIETMPKLGYRLIADVEPVGADNKLELPRKPSIAVLPFSNMSGDPEQEYFSDGITDDIITGLSRSPWLFVIARNSSFAYRGHAGDERKIARELGVRHILEGSVRKFGARVRITAQLIDGITGGHVWAEKYDEQLEDMFDLQDEITRKVVASIQTEIHLTGSVSGTVERPSLEVWELVALAWKSLYGLDKVSLAECEKYAAKAVALDPSSCEAHLMLAAGLFHNAWLGIDKDFHKTLDHGLQHAKRAVELDEMNEYAHWIYGLSLLGKRDHESAILQLKRGVELNPNCSLAYGSLGTVLSYAGHADESILNNKIAIRSNPKDRSIFFRFASIAIAHFVSERYEQAEEWARETVSRKPKWDVGHIILAASLYYLGQPDSAKIAAERYLDELPTACSSDVERLPFKNPSYAEKIIRALLQLGVPE